MRLSLLLCLLPLFPDLPRIVADKDPTKVSVEARLPVEALKDLPAGKWTQDLGETWLRFAVVKKDGVGLPMIGTYQRQDDLLIFKPRYDLEPGTLYRASFGADSAKAHHRLPRPGETGHRRGDGGQDFAERRRAASESPEILHLFFCPHARRARHF